MICVTLPPQRMSRTSKAVAFGYSALLLLLVPFAQAQPITSSKLSAHLINSYTTGVSNIVAGHPRVLKILDLCSGMLQAARAYKAGTPNGKIEFLDDGVAAAVERVVGV